MTKEQMAAVLSRAFAAVFSEEAALAFSDAALEGFKDGTFKPGHPVARAQAAAAIYRLLLE